MFAAGSAQKCYNKDCSNVADVKGRKRCSKCLERFRLGKIENKVSKSLSATKNDSVYIKPKVGSVSISKFTKVDQFADVLPKDLAELCFDYAEEYPKMDHRDIIAGIYGHYVKVRKPEDSEDDDIDEDEEDDKETVEPLADTFSDIGYYIHLLEGIIADKIFSSDLGGTYMTIKHNESTMNIIYNVCNWEKFDEYEEVQNFLLEINTDKRFMELGCHFNKISDLYRFILLFMSVYCYPYPLNYKSNFFLKYIDYGDCSYDINFNVLYIPESMKEILLKEIYGIYKPREVRRLFRYCKKTWDEATLKYDSSYDESDLDSDDNEEDDNDYDCEHFPGT